MKTFLNKWQTPLALLVLLVISFGLLIPQLGFYWDDWPVILTGRLQGAAGYQAFYQFDRPISAWTYIVTFPILGSQPIRWHIFTLLLRWATSVALWWTLTLLWPRQRQKATWAALLFAVYPVFIQQAISVAYSQHWICYLLLLISLGAMLKAQRLAALGGSRWYWPLTGVSLASSLLGLFTMEYFAGLELLRPFLLWILASERPGATRGQRVAATLRAWLPYLVGLAVFVIWRLFFLKFPGQDANVPSLLKALLAHPLQAGPRFLEIAIQDSLHLLVQVWAGILVPANINLRDRFILFTWGISLLVAGAAVVFLLRQPAQAETDEAGGLWRRQALAIGVIAVLLGTLPVWFTDRQMSVGLYANRFGLPAMLGASLLVTALLEILIRRPVQRIVILGLLLGLAAGMHLRVANEYRWSWASQKRFYWQLSWRAPNIQPNTALAADGEIFMYVGLYSTSMGVNLLYPPAANPNQLPYWFYSLGRDFSYDKASVQTPQALKTTFRNYTFNASNPNTVMLFYAPGLHDCLEVLTPQDHSAPDIPQITRKALALANPGRIQAGPAQPGYPPTEIFGPEPERGWCYIYEKADLARSQGDWQQVTRLGDQAQAIGFAPRASSSNTAFEWLPFIEGYAHTGRWQAAQALSVSAYERDTRIDARMCSLWQSLTTDLPPSSERDQAAAAVREKIKCP